MKKRRKRNQGSALVVVMWITVLFLIAGIYLWNYNSFFSVRTRADTQAYSICDSAIEFVRGAMQSATFALTPQPPVTSDDVLYFPTRQRLFYSSGAPVDWSMPSSFFTGIGQPTWKDNVYGVPVTDPNNGRIIGYAAYFMVRGAQQDIADIYAMGALGTSPTAIYARKQVHARIKPYTYSEYTLFSGNPNQNVTLSNTYTDPFFGASGVFQGSASFNYGAGAPVTGGAATRNFNKIFVAGNININVPASGSLTPYPQFNGFDMATFQVKGTRADPVQALAPIEIPSTAQLYTGAPPAPDQGLPWSQPRPSNPSETSQVEQLMSSLHTNAFSTGVVLNEAPSSGNAFYMADDPYYTGAVANPAHNKFVISTEDPADPTALTGTSYIPGANSVNTCSFGPCRNWDPTTIIDPSTSTEDTRYNQPYDIQLNSNGTITVDGFAVDQTVYVNGAATSVTAGTPLTINPNTLPNKILYIKGNATVHGTLNGTVTVVAEGRITVTDDVRYSDRTYTDRFVGPTQVGIDVGPSSKPYNPDMLGLITPRKIELDPQTNVDNLAVSAVMTEMGSNPQSYSPPLGADDPSIKWTLHLNPLSPHYIPITSGGLFDSNNPYHSINFFGSQVQYSRDKNWVNFYSNGRGSPIDPTLLPASSFAVYDSSLLQNEPPFSIALSAGYQVVYWAPIHDTTGADLKVPLR